MSEIDSDVRELERGAQVTFEQRDMTRIGEVGDYLGEGNYIVVDEDDNEHELHMESLSLVDEA